jgi:hypothetical protein
LAKAEPEPLQKPGNVITNPPAKVVLAPESELLMIGSAEQRDAFAARFDR